PFFRIEPTARIAYWARGGSPVTLAVKDENGMLWKELEGTSAAGLNVVEYDLSTEPKLADAAEAKAREKALAKEKDREKEKEKEKESDKKDGDGRDAGQKDFEKAKDAPAIPPASAAASAKKASGDEDEDEDEEEAGKPEDDRPSTGPAKPLDQKLYELLADPQRSTRKRYLPPGKYTVEIRSGQAVEKTKLNVQAERETGFGGED